MTDNTQPEAGSTHIIRYALEMGLLWIDGDGRDKVREALDALETLEAQLEAIGAGGVNGPLMGRVPLSANAGEEAQGVGNSCFDHQTAADFLSGKTVSDEAVRKFVQASRWAHDEKAALSAMLLSVRGVLASREAEIALLKKALMEAEAAPRQGAQEPCPTCVALARAVMCDQVSFDRKPDCYGIRQITDDEGVEEWEDIRTSPDVAREEANDMMATGRGEIYEVVPLWTTPQLAPQPAPAAQGDALNNTVRVPLDSLHADAAYLIGRLQLDTMDGARVVEIIRERIEAAKAALAAQAQEAAPAAQGDARAEQSLLKVLTAVQRYLPPDGPSAKDTLSEIIGIVDPWPLGDLKGKA